MWPKLVANKLLRKRMGNDCFVADHFPSTETLHEVSTSTRQYFSPNNPTTDRRETHKYKMFVSTWNVGGLAPRDDLNLEDWLDPCNNPCDIYVLGFQETVPLSAGNILGAENSRVSMKWNSLIRAALNKTRPSSWKKEKKNQEGKVGEKQKVYPVKDGDQRTLLRHDFKCIVSKQMVGIFITIWVRGELHRFIRHPSVSCVGCGIMGCLGNKGSVSVRFWLQETSFCIVCSHLASGGKNGDETHRNSNATEILYRTNFPCGPSRDLPQKILDHQRIIWLGDLNYRISLPEAMTRSLAEKMDWDALFRNDQLRAELREGGVFEGWQEGIIEFAPTYKYHPNSDKYYSCDQIKKGKTKRAPAWCDRILWYGKGLKQKQYSRGESQLSDHRPVRSIFSVEVDAGRNNSKFFLSERFEKTLHHFDIISNEDLKSDGEIKFSDLGFKE